MKKTVILIVTVVFCAAMLTACSNDPESVAEKYAEAWYIDCDARAATEYVHEDAVNYLADGYRISEEELIEDMQSDLDESFEFRGGSCNVMRTEPADEDTLGDYRDRYNEFGCFIEEAQIAVVELISGTTTDVIDIAVVKIDGKWYAGGEV